MDDAKIQVYCKGGCDAHQRRQVTELSDLDRGPTMSISSKTRYCNVNSYVVKELVGSVRDRWSPWIPQLTFVLGQRVLLHELTGLVNVQCCPIGVHIARNDLYSIHRTCVMLRTG